MTRVFQFFATIALTVFATLTVNAQMEFIENKGQWDSRVKYRGDFGSGSFFLESRGFTVDLHNVADLQTVNDLHHGHLTSATASKAAFAPNYATPTVPADLPPVIIHSHAYKVVFLGGNPNVVPVPEKMEQDYNNYFIGNNPSKWAANCKIYQAITYPNVYPNIDVRYYTDGDGLKYDFIVHPGGNPNAIALRYDGTSGLSIKNKELVIGTSIGDIKELYPYSYQNELGKKLEVDCRYQLSDNVVRFKISNYNVHETLVIDPKLIFSSYTGSRADNWGYTATPAPDGSMYVAGIVYGNGYPVSAGAYQTVFGGGISDDATGQAYDIGLFKFSAGGSQRLYATYIGGNGNEQPHSMICDDQGNLILAGRSSSNNFPGTPSRGTSRRDYDIVLIKLNPAGTTALGAIRIGGTANDGLNVRAKYVAPQGDDAIRRNYGDDARSEVILDKNGDVILASCTQSSDFPVSANAVQPAFGGGKSDPVNQHFPQDGVILKFTPNLSSVLFSTYFGGGGDDACFVAAVNPVTGNIYIGGSTTSTTLPGDKSGTVGTTYGGGETDGFVTQLLPDGSAIIKTAFIGTSGTDMLYGLKFDKFGYPYIMGTTTGNWPVINATYSNPNSKQFIGKLMPDFSSYVYSTVFGSGSNVPNISPIAFLVDRCQNVYVSGWGGGLDNLQSYTSAGTFGMPIKNQLTSSNGNPITSPDGADFYFFVMENNAKSQLFGSYFGQTGGLGDHVDGGTSRFDENGVIYQAICSCPGQGAGPFPTTPGAWAIVSGSPSCNEVAAKIEMNFSGVGASVKASIDGVYDTIGCVPLQVNFVDTLAKGKMYIWHYDDGAAKDDTTYAPNNTTSHLYNNTGYYLVRLVAIDSSTCNIADTAYIHLRVGNNQVVPNFNFTKLDSCTSLRFRFDNTTTAPNPAYTNKTFTWDFGDGSPRVNTGFTSLIHTFPSVGQYTVRLIVDDTIFCNSPDSVARQIRINPNVKATFITSPRGCVAYTPIFQNTSLGGTQWLWDLGDGTFSTAFEPVHTYNQVGSYNVRLIATDTTTCNKVDTSAYFTITVYPIPTAGFTWSPNPPLENTRTYFTNQSVGATRYFWDFGDGGTSTDVNPSHQYNKTDVFKVVLVAYNDADCPDTARADVATIIKPLLDVPSAFTPGRFTGGSYNNGIVKVEGFGIGKMDWKIYNRWGQVVFSSNNPANGWDGTFKGQLQPMDVYTYTLDVEFTDGKKLRKTGDITLLR
ncbi:MAG: PKD domain-containing protein [Bacteroidetes bacterium]|nr:PKD domain-containing protein [Bacteroidota bacterium]